MPRVDAAGVQINYELEGDGEPLVLIPCLAADRTCYAFQLPEYTGQFACITVELPGTGASDTPPGPYSTATHADQVVAVLGALGIESAHVAGLSLGAAVATHVAARYPARVRSLTLSSGWGTTDAFMARCMQNWRELALAMPTVADAVILGVFPWCFTPRMYTERPEFVASIEAFVRTRPPQSLEGFLAQTEAVLDHDAAPVLGDIVAPTLLTAGALDNVTGTRCLGPLASGIPHAEVVVFEHLSHAGLNEDPDTFNRATLEFMRRHAG